MIFSLCYVGRINKKSLLSCSDLDKIREGIGDKIALLFSWVTTFVGGFIVAFITDWRLSLVCLGIVPFLAIVVFFSANVSEPQGLSLSLSLSLPSLPPVCTESAS